MDYQDVFPDVTEVERVITSLNQQPVAHETLTNAARVLALQVLGVLAALEGIRRQMEAHNAEIAALAKQAAAKQAAK